MLTFIIAQDEQNGIGKNNELPWPNITQDMQHFRSKTLDHVVIMGHKTFESINRNPLDRRVNIVISHRHENDSVEIGDPADKTSLHLVNSLTKALDVANEKAEEGDDIFVIGGAKIYEAFRSEVRKIILTRIPGDFEADTFFDLHLDNWTLQSSEPVEVDGQLICTFEEYLLTE